MITLPEGGWHRFGPFWSYFLLGADGASYCTRESQGGGVLERDRDQFFSSSLRLCGPHTHTLAHPGHHIESGRERSLCFWCMRTVTVCSGETQEVKHATRLRWLVPFVGVLVPLIPSLVRVFYHFVGGIRGWLGPSLLSLSPNPPKLDGGMRGA